MLELCHTVIVVELSDDGSAISDRGSGTVMLDPVRGRAMSDRGSGRVVRSW